MVCFLMQISCTLFYRAFALNEVFKESIGTTPIKFRAELLGM